MNPPPQENQPGEAAQDLDRSEPQAECHTPHNVSEGVKRLGLATRQLDDITTIICGVEEQSTGRYVLYADYATERAKRLELEGELALSKQHADEGWSRALIEQEKAQTARGECVRLAEQNSIAVKAIAALHERQNALKAELLALRGKGGQTDLVRPETKADGESVETATPQTN